MDTILVLDFGSQTTQLIGRRVRQLGVYSRIVAGDAPYDEVMSPEVKGVILSGSPSSVYEEDAPRDQLRVLRAEVEDQDPVRMDIRGGPRHVSPVSRSGNWGLPS